MKNLNMLLLGTFVLSMIVNIMSWSKPDAITNCNVDLGDDIEITLGDSIRLQPIISCNISQVQSIKWEPAQFLNCTDCFLPFSYPLEDICYTATVTATDGCISTDEICISLKSCDSEFSEDRINNITPQQINEEAQISLEIAKFQFGHIEIIKNGQVEHLIWEGWLSPGLQNITLNFAEVPSGNHELRVRLYPENKTITIQKL